MKLKDIYKKLYNDVKRGEYDIATVDENDFKMKASISFIDLLKDCDKEGVNIESFLKYAKEQKRDGMGDTVSLITNELGDWEVLLLNGKVYHEGHNIPTRTWLNLIRELGHEVSTKDLTDEEIERGLF